MNISSNPRLKPANWHNLVLFAIAFWFSSSVLIDFLIMPGLFVSGMMSQDNFGTAGYSLFWLFNRVEILCGAVVLTGLLVLRHQRDESSVLVSGTRSRWSLELAGVLLGIALIYTYLLTPTMSALGMPLDLFQPQEIPAGMNQMHALYWALEGVKLVASALLLRLCYSDLQPADQ
ncbi:DUF4149 domain-containing protein [Pseudanabaena sp. FACHB-2040]|uniref:DUF4149 domain-containing protein n=1 Tax=Pseudanabaena sp. FACHB-2040 TaxID=2692859 RepID=UPI0016877F22|nr:DUF4149 domain-containing protein [Pseudanabaena sp. FACHB-2040]MBD2260065.1 DUF4149 domain-containing protein [Pseudanabaena sp. FACHB-2040]